MSETCPLRTSGPAPAIPRATSKESAQSLPPCGGPGFPTGSEQRAHAPRRLASRDVWGGGSSQGARQVAARGGRSSARVRVSRTAATVEATQAPKTTTAVARRAGGLLRRPRKRTRGGHPRCIAARRRHKPDAPNASGQVPKACAGMPGAVRTTIVAGGHQQPSLSPQSPTAGCAEGR